MGSDIASLSFWFNFIYFFIAAGFAFYIPGSFLLKKISLSILQKTVLATIVGMVMWGMQGYIF
jgi:ammonia channel protein AmtB